MGNMVSCILMSAPSIMNKNPKDQSATVVFPNGEVRRLRGQPTVTAAELMLECPNFFLANTRSLHVGRRFSALNADAELESGNFYIMFPMERVKSTVTAVDMALSRHVGSYSGSGRVSEVARNYQQDADFQDPGSTHGEAEQFSVVLKHRHRLSSFGSRKPLLETIREEPVWSR